LRAPSLRRELRRGAERQWMPSASRDDAAPRLPDVGCAIGVSVIVLQNGRNLRIFVVAVHAAVDDGKMGIPPSVPFRSCRVRQQ